MSARSWRRGLVDAVQGSRVKVCFPDLDGLVSDWLPVAQLCAMGARVWMMPRVGSQVTVLLDEHAEDGVVLGGLYSQADPAPDCAPGGFHLELEDGTAITLGPGVATLKAPSLVLDGSVTVRGPLTVEQDATISGKSFLTHRHTAQGPTSPTSVPV